MKSLSILLGLYGIALAFPNNNIGELIPFHHPKFQPEIRIINGSDAKPHAYPYHVFLRMYSALYTERCAGSLISPDTVLTAAHCLTDVYKIEVTLGAHNLSDKEATQIKVISTDFTFHENWDESTYQNDVGIIKLPYPIVPNKAIQTVKLPAVFNNSYANCTANVTGWGKTADVPSNRGSQVLQVLQTRVMTNEECKAVPKYEAMIVDTHLCTDGKGVTGFCDGDSGGPLVINGVQIGIASFTYKNCSEAKPSVYTRVTKYMDWIKQHAGLK